MQHGAIGLCAVLAVGCAVPVEDESELASELTGGGALVVHWNEVAVQAVGASAPFPSSRFMATTHTAVFEAVNAITREYEPYLGTVHAPANASPEAAAVTAAHDVLVGFFPAQAGFLDGERDASLAAIPDGPRKTAGIAVGQDAAAAMLANRTNDGSTPVFNHLPANSDPGEWQLTPSCSPAGGVFENWQFVKPFGVVSSHQFRAPPPPPLGSRRYAESFDETHLLGAIDSTHRSPERANVALVYAAQPPHTGWNSIARQLATAHPRSLTDTARIFALLNMALSDAHITVIESKYHYTWWRPQTAIPRGDEDGNPRTAPAPFTPFVTTPCHPSYPSGHGVGAGSCSAVLQHFYGDGGHDLVTSDPAVPGVVLHNSRLSDIVRDVSDARVYGGIHWRYDQDAAEEMGQRVARFDLRHLLRDDRHCDD